METCNAVIGSFYGDEGKGHVTDILSDYESTLNVRFNGGAQAAHTVDFSGGFRHAFHHFGSGTFRAAHTYLSEYFIVNPGSFILERAEIIHKFGIKPVVFVNKNCLVTTPWDMYINQALERLRGSNRHGSCGFGINETIMRSEKPKYRITVEDLLYEDKLIEKLHFIQDEYIHICLGNYNKHLNMLDIDLKNYILDKSRIDMFVYFVKEFLEFVSIKGNNILNRYKNVVFEGAQGLLLDKDNLESFPHVTPSKTGIKNVMSILSDVNYCGKMSIYYVSRCYITRHGAGPLKNELFDLPYPNVRDDTNIPNEFQGSLRFSYLDLDLLIENILDDLKNNDIYNSSNIDINIVFTCFDQLEDTISFYQKGILKSVDKNLFKTYAKQYFTENNLNVNELYFTDSISSSSFKI